MAYITCQEDIPLKQRLGVDCLNSLNQKMLLLKSSVDAITEAISDLYPHSSIEKNAYGRTIKVNNMPCVIYQMHGHCWGIIEILRPVFSFKQESFLNSISQKLKVHAILFEQSDTSSFIKYHFFSSGELLELFEFRWDGIGREDFVHETSDINSICILEFRYSAEEQESSFERNEEVSSEANCYFKSSLRHLSTRDISDPYAFVDNFFKEQNLYIPGVIWSTKASDIEDIVLRLRGLSSNDFESFSCLMLPIDE